MTASSPIPLPPAGARATVPIDGRVQFGPGRLVLIAGPCAVETREQLLVCARAAAASGASMLRGGAFKPRTSRHSFQGLGRQGLALLAEAAAETGLPVVTEVLDPRDVGHVAQVAAVLQIGARSMQNFPLLREVGRQPKPVLLKRGSGATIDELLHAADYVAGEGNQRILLCERGIRSFEPGTRYTLDLAAVPQLQARSPWPVVVDPSHGTGRRDLVPAMARAAVAAGADGLLIEVHPEPARALCDGPQAILPDELGQLVPELAAIAAVLGRELAPGPEPRTGTARERTPIEQAGVRTR